MKAYIGTFLVVVILFVVAFNVVRPTMVDSVTHGADTIAHTSLSGVRPLSPDGPFKALVDYVWCMANTNSLDGCN